MNAGNESHLVERACQGDEEAFADLVRANYGTVYGLTFCMVGDWAAAEDLAQETFLQAWSHRMSLRNVAAFPAWLRRIARNLAKNYVRNAVYRRRLAERYRAETVTEGVAPPPDAPLEAAGRREAMWSALHALAPEQREAVVLYYLHGRSVREVAYALGIGESAAKKRLQYARSRLRSHLETEWRKELMRAGDGIHATTARERFLTGLAAGPALPELGGKLAATSMVSWRGSLHLLQHIVTEGIAMNMKKAILTGAITAVLLIAGLGLVQWRNTEAQPPDTSTPEQSQPEMQVEEASAQPSQRPPEALIPPSNGSAAPDADAIPASEPNADEYAPKRITDPRKYAWIDGLVTDNLQTPIPNAAVTVVATGLTVQDGPSSAGAAAAFQAALTNGAHYWDTVTGDDGRFLIKNIHFMGVAIADVRAAGFQTANEIIPLKDDGEGAHVEFQLHPGATVRGRILDRNGHGVSDGMVFIVGMAGGNSSRGGSSHVPTKTDHSGYFEFVVIPSGVVSIKCSSETHGDAVFANIPINPEETVELRYPGLGRLYGSVRQQDGTPVANARVEARGEIFTQSFDPVAGGGSTCRDGNTYETITADDGAFDIVDVIPGQQYALTAFDADGEFLASGSTAKTLESDEAKRVELVVKNIIRVGGTARGATTHRRLPGLGVKARNEHRQVFFAETDEDGHFEMSIPGPEGEYEFMAETRRGPALHSGIAGPYVKKVELTHGHEHTVDLVCPEPATRTFQLLSNSGAPIEGARLEVHVNNVYGTHQFYDPGSSTDEEGRVTWENVPTDAETSVRFLHPDYFPATSRAVTPEPNETRPEETLVMYGLAGLSGRVTNEGGQPLTEAAVHLVARWDGQETRINIRTDDEGAFTLGEKLPATSVDMTITHDPEDGGPELGCELEAIPLEPLMITELGDVDLTP